MTNAGTVPIYGFILGPLPATPQSVGNSFVLRRLHAQRGTMICNRRGKRSFSSGPFNYIGCGLPQGIRPGSSVVASIGAGFSTLAQAAASAGTRVKVTPQATAREAYGF